MADRLIEGYLAAKMHHMPSGAALYMVSSDVDGIEIAKKAYDRVRHGAAAMFGTAQDLGKNPLTVATVVLAAMNGIARRLLESDQPASDLPELRQELLVMVHSSLRACEACLLSRFRPAATRSEVKR